MPILAIRSSTRTLQSTWKRVVCNGTHTSQLRGKNCKATYYISEKLKDSCISDFLTTMAMWLKVTIA